VISWFQGLLFTCNLSRYATQNLSSRIKNSHAFKLPTIYLPRDDLAVPIPNALEVGGLVGSHFSQRPYLTRVIKTNTFNR
jgi:hypothetical protein